MDTRYLFANKNFAFKEEVQNFTEFVIMQYWNSGINKLKTFIRLNVIPTNNDVAILKFTYTNT